MGSHNPNFGAARLFFQSLANIGSPRMGAGASSSILRGGLEYYEPHSHTYRGGRQFQFHKGISPNIKEMKILDGKKVRRAKLYYLRDRMNALKK